MIEPASIRIGSIVRVVERNSKKQYLARYHAPAYAESSGLMYFKPFYPIIKRKGEVGGGLLVLFPSDTIEVLFY
jgi:hypothetical protein